MKRFAIKSLLIAAATQLLGTQPALASSTDHLTATLEARFKQDRTGVCVLAALIEGSHVSRSRYCARPRVDGGPGADAAFEIGSISKTMTAFLVADLIAADQWSLDDPIAKHLPEGTVVPRQGERQILVRDLLTHSAGLPAVPSRLRSVDPANPYANLSEADLLASLAEVQLSRPIGSQAEYSNFGMMVVSLAVARAHGGDFEKALRSKLFEPLQMNGAFIARAPAGVTRAQGHLPSSTATKAWTITPTLAGVGMVRATLDDMVRYAQAQLGSVDTPLRARLQATQRPLAHGFAMNWAMLDIQGHKLLVHEGGTGGFSSLLALEPAKQRALVILADTALTDLGGLGDVGLALLDPAMPPSKPRLAATPPPALRKALLGEYELAGLNARIFEQDGRLMGQAEGQPALELLYDSHGDFYPTAVSALLTPVLADGRVDRFAWRQGGGVLEGVRKGSQRAPTATNPLWKDWAGDYQLAPQFSLRVFEADGKLLVQGTGQPAIAAQMSGTDRIEIKAVGAVVEFKRGAGGEVVSATLLQGGQKLDGKRK